MYIDERIKKYILEIINTTRNPDKFILKDLVKYITTRSSTRGTIYFMMLQKQQHYKRNKLVINNIIIKNLA